MKPYHQRPTWRWLPGMLAEDSDGARWRVYAIARHTGYPLAVREGDERVRPECGALVHDAAPVLDDPATQGAALAVLREVTGDACLSVACAGRPVGRWYLIYGRATTAVVADIAEATEAKALAAALDLLIPE